MRCPERQLHGHLCGSCCSPPSKLPLCMLQADQGAPRGVSVSEASNAPTACSCATAPWTALGGGGCSTVSRKPAAGPSFSRWICSTSSSRGTLTISGACRQRMHGVSPTGVHTLARCSMGRGAVPSVCSLHEEAEGIPICMKTQATTAGACWPRQLFTLVQGPARARAQLGGQLAKTSWCLCLCWEHAMRPCQLLTESRMCAKLPHTCAAAPTWNFFMRSSKRWRREQGEALPRAHAPRAALALQRARAADPVLHQQAHAPAGVVPALLWAAAGAVSTPCTQARPARCATVRFAAFAPDQARAPVAGLAASRTTTELYQVPHSAADLAARLLLTCWSTASLHPQLLKCYQPTAGWVCAP